MKKSVIAYVYGTVAASAVALFVLRGVAPEFDVPLLAGPALLTLVAILGTLLSYRVQSNAAGAVSFIPYLTAVVLYPNWVTALVVGVGALIAELVRPKIAIKRAFNVAQILLASSVGSLVYVGLGGRALELDSSFQFLPHTAAVIIFLTINTSLVAAVISLADGRSFGKTWIEGNAAGLVIDVMAVPFVFAFARAYVDWGLWGIGLLCALVVGVKMTYESKYTLETTNGELLQLFVHTVEYRDPYTAGHSQRVERYSRIIAKLYGLPQKEIDRIGNAAKLHDVGKIHEIFGPILSKPGRLTPEERAIMELHPIKSAELVAKITTLKDIVADVRHHHENWDGTGYPDGLRGHEIPLGSRIIMFADTIDAMTTDRPYRKALGEAEVRSELAKYRGIQFDPDICDALVNSPGFHQLFDAEESGRVRPITQRLERLLRGRSKTAEVA